MSSPQETEILKTVVQFSWFEYTMMGAAGLVLITFLLSLFFYFIRIIIECFVEKPGQNNLQPFALCKEKNFKGFKESCCWSCLSFLFVMEGFSVYLLALSLSSFSIVASAFSLVNIAVPMTITILLVALALTHSCRERHLLNFIHDTEVQDVQFNDYGTLQAPTTDLPPDPDAVEPTPPETPQDIDSQNNSIQEYKDEQKNFCANCCQLTFGNYFDSLKIGLYKKLIPFIIVLAISIVIRYSQRFLIF